AARTDRAITFTNDAPIDSQLGEFHNLTLNAGSGAMRFNEDLGAKQRLNLLTIENASQVIFGQADSETAGAGTTGPVNQINTGGAIDIGSQSAVTGGITFNGGASGLAVFTTGDNVRLN